MTVLPEQQTPQGRAMRDIAILLLAAALLLVPGMFVRDLWPPDETRYMQVAREMAETGDYLVPRINGEVYPSKPPVFFWLAAALYKLGFGFEAGRTLAVLAAAGTLLLVYFAARREMSPPGPLLAALVPLTTLSFLTAKAGVIDPPLMFFVTSALVCGYRALGPETRHRTAYWLAFYALAALGVLTKGPVGALVPGLVLLAYGIMNRRQVRGGGWAHLVGAGLFVAMVAAWLVPAMIRGGQAYAQEIGINQTISRLTRSSDHARPFYHYVMWYPVAFFPWSALFPLAVAAAVAGWRKEVDRSARFAVVWFVTTLVFFSLVSGKRLGYLLPALPAVGLAIGGYFSRGLRDGFRWEGWYHWLLRATFVLCVLLAAVGGVSLIALPKIIAASENYRELIEQRLPELLGWRTRAAGLLGLGGILVVSCCGVWMTRGRPGRGQPVWCLVMLMLLVSVVADLYVAPKVNEVKSPLAFCRRAMPYLDEAGHVYLFGGDRAGAYNVYTGRLIIPVLQQAAEIREILASPTRAAVLIQERNRIDTLGKDCPYPIPVRQWVGGVIVELVINWAPEEFRGQP